MPCRVFDSYLCIQKFSLLDIATLWILCMTLDYEFRLWTHMDPHTSHMSCTLHNPFSKKQFYLYINFYLFSGRVSINLILIHKIFFLSCHIKKMQANNSPIFAVMYFFNPASMSTAIVHIKTYSMYSDSFFSPYFVMLQLYTEVESVFFSLSI